MIKLTKLAEWQTLKQHFEVMQHIHMRNLFAEDAQRTQKFAISAAGIKLDYSKNRLTKLTIDHLCDLAKACNLKQKINNLFNDSPALHTALRQSNDNPVYYNGHNIIPDIRSCQQKIRTLVKQVHSGKAFTNSGKKITDIVNIGIGGSELGPKMASEALSSYNTNGIKLHFISNIDGAHLEQTLKHINPESTLFFIASKSFTTTETLMNAKTIIEWVNNPNLQQHFYAITANSPAAIAFGINAENIFPIWKWVIGRFSVWSAIGISLCIAIGIENFEHMLNGAEMMDLHFKNAGLKQNMPVILALISIWYINFFNATTQAILPYSHPLRYFPEFLKQLEMESNGKSIRLDGSKVDYATSPIVWGGVGCNSQHSFHQLLFQGTHLIPADFIVAKQSASNFTAHQQWLVENCINQTQALMQGLSLEEAANNAPEQIAKFKVIDGNNPSQLISFEKLTPHTLGALIALYEHKVFVQTAIWGINAFDQHGVELGKQLNLTQAN